MSNVLVSKVGNRVLDVEGDFARIIVGAVVAGVVGGLVQNYNINPIFELILGIVIVAVTGGHPFLRTTGIYIASLGAYETLKQYLHVSST